MSISSIGMLGSASYQPYSCTIDTPPLAPSAFLTQQKHMLRTNAVHPIFW